MLKKASADLAETLGHADSVEKTLDKFNQRSREFWQKYNELARQSEPKVNPESN